MATDALTKNQGNVVQGVTQIANVIVGAADKNGHGKATVGAGIGGLFGGLLGSFGGPVGTAIGTAVGGVVLHLIGEAIDAAKE